MTTIFTAIHCDGCGASADAAHIAERVERLELATRYRPIHINVLVVAMAPSLRPQDDFYRPPEAREFFDNLLAALDIPVPAGTSTAAGNSDVQPANNDACVAGLTEFQRRGYYLTYVSECPVAQSSAESSRKTLAQLAPTLIKRIQRNYKPQHITLLGAELSPLIDILKSAGLGSLLLLDEGRSLTLPPSHDRAAQARFREVISEATSRAASSSVV